MKATEARTQALAQDDLGGLLPSVQRHLRAKTKAPGSVDSGMKITGVLAEMITRPGGGEA